VLVAIAEGFVAIRHDLLRLFGAVGIDVVGELGDPYPTPDLVLVDARVPGGLCGRDAPTAPAPHRRWPSVPVLVLSPQVEERYAVELLRTRTRGIGYLLEERVADVDDFVEAMVRVAAGGVALDPEVVAQLLVRRRDGPLDRLTPRHVQVIGMIAEGRSIAGVAVALKMSDSAVTRYVESAFARLGLTPAKDEYGRVLAVLRFLKAAG